jgi:FkbM family methyltransferase
MEPDLIYDVGMHDGSDTAYYLHKGYRVVGIEADPAMVAVAAARFKPEISAGRLIILNVAIAESKGTMPFYLFDKLTQFNSFCPSPECLKLTHRIVHMPCDTFGSVLSRYGVPFYLKVDIEGKDACCVEALDADLPKFVSLENYNTQSLITSITKLYTLGFNRFKLIDQHHLLPMAWPPTLAMRQCKLWLGLYKSGHPLARLVRKLGAAALLQKKLSRSRSKDGWIFPYGSSGPFGDDLPGPWQSFDEICKLIRKFSDSWSDCHAAR